MAYVEQVARMLAVQRGDNLAGVQIGERHDLDFHEPEFLFDGR